MVVAVDLVAELQREGVVQHTRRVILFTRHHTELYLQQSLTLDGW